MGLMQIIYIILQSDKSVWEKKEMAKDQENKKIDKGFEFNYWKLSYRRKFIRTLWITPFIIPVLVYVWIKMHSISITIITALVLIAIYITQLLYTYRKWKNNDISIK